MNIMLTYRNMVRQLLPPHKRQLIRIQLLDAFLSPLQQLFNDFRRWRENFRMMINVNSQVKVFEGYLRKKYDEPIGIKVVTFNNGLLLVGTISEGKAMWPEFGFEDEEYYQSIPLEYEIRDKFDGVDFVVYIPSTLDVNLIDAEIQKYKQVLTTYKIIQQ